MDGDRLTNDLAALRIDRSDRRGERPPRSLARPILVAGAVAAVVVAAVVGYPYLRARVVSPEVTVTEVGIVSPAQGSVRLTASGYLTAETTAKVGTKVVGRIARLAVEEGSVVKKGDLIAQLDDESLRSLIASARAKVATARARAQQARAQLAETQQQEAREKLLAEGGVSPKATYEDLVARDRSLSDAVRAADAEVKAVEADVSALETQLADTTITAPIEGVVVSKNVQMGDVVNPQIGNSIVDLADFNSLVAEVDVPETRLAQVGRDGPCEIMLDAFPGQRYRGTTWWIGRRVDRSKGSVKVKVKFADIADHAIPDMAVRVNFLDKELDAASMKEQAKVVIPASAVAERGGAKVAWIIEDGKARLRSLALGDKLGGGWVVNQGVTAGARVIANPSDDLRDGQSVKEKRD
jgi:HlyD family secretion protein